MKRTLRLAQWGVAACGILLLFWVAATVGGWSPDIRTLTSSVHGPLVADYRADSSQVLAPLSPAITNDAAQDQAGAGHPRPTPTASGGPTPSGPATPSPTGSGVLPTLPVPTPTLPVPTPTLPVPTPTLPIPTPTLPPLPLPTPPLPTPPPLF